MKRSFYPLIGCALLLMPITACKSSTSSDPVATTTTAQADSATTAKADTTTQAAPTDSVKPAVDEKHTEAYIEKRVETMYKARNNTYLTKAFKKAIKASEVPGEIGPIDYDIWLRAQDEDQPRATVKSVKLIDENNAEAQVWVYPFGKQKEHSKVRVVLRFERGDWYVDNFISEGSNDRKLLRGN